MQIKNGHEVISGHTISLKDDCTYWDKSISCAIVKFCIQYLSDIYPIRNNDKKRWTIEQEKLSDNCHVCYLI